MMYIIKMKQKSMYLIFGMNNKKDSKGDDA